MRILQIARSLSAPLISLALFVMANAFLATFISVQLHLQGYSDSVVGIVGGCYWSGIILGTLFTERLIARVGYIRAFAIFAATLTAAMMAQVLVPPPWLWIPLRVLAGFCTSGLYVVIESWLLEESTPKTRGRVLAVYMICLYAAQSAGQFFINSTHPESLTPFFTSIVLTSLSICPVCFSRKASPTPKHTKFLGLIRLYRAAPVGVMSCLASGLILGSIYSLMPVYVQEAGLGLDKVALTMGTIIMGGFILQWPIGRLSDLLDRRVTVILVSFATALLSTLFLFAKQFSLPVQLVLFTLFGGSAFTLYPLSISHSCDRIRGMSLVSITATMLLVYGIGAMCGPMLAPLLEPKIGVWSIPLFCAAVAALLTLFTTWRVLVHEPVPLEEQVGFVSMPRTGPVSSRLDPRVEAAPSVKEAESEPSETLPESLP